MTIFQLLKAGNGTCSLGRGGSLACQTGHVAPQGRDQLGNRCCSQAVPSLGPIHPGLDQGLDTARRQPQHSLQCCRQLASAQRILVTHRDEGAPSGNILFDIRQRRPFSETHPALRAMGTLHSPQTVQVKVVQATAAAVDTDANSKLLPAQRIEADGARLDVADRNVLDNLLLDPLRNLALQSAPEPGSPEVQLTCRGNSKASGSLGSCRIWGWGIGLGGLWGMPRAGSEPVQRALLSSNTSS
mmetsp:Transcript_77878/g.252464  ORF Transcript_77878/g.252464 Transcript_77878/m.252464 type:complete len:243 (+) Transcript_77878:1066-1794(+)